MNANTKGTVKELNEGMLLVDSVKLAEGLNVIFKGLTMVFDSLCAEYAESVEKSSKVTGETASSTTTGETADKPTVEESRVEDSVQKEPSVTVEDITKVIVAKIRQKRSNSDLIQKLVTAYGVKKVSELPKEKYEAFMTDLAQI